jgi:uncharacterized membrane protein HdeD (DUF308 family)
MDLKLLTQGRSMLLARGAIAIALGIVAGNQLEISASSFVWVFAVWALVEGAATLRQAYAPTQGLAHIEVRPVLLLLGGISVAAGVLSVLALAVSSGVAIGVLALWLLVRGGFEVLAVVRSTGKTRVLFGLVAAIDGALAALAATNMSGAPGDLAMVCGGLAAVWGGLYVVIGLTTRVVTEMPQQGRRLLDAR